MHLDPDTFVAGSNIIYDKRGREWMVYYFGTGCDNEWKRFYPNMGHYDVQRQYGTTGRTTDMRTDVDFLDPEFFAMDNLKRHFGGR